MTDKTIGDLDDATTGSNAAFMFEAETTGSPAASVKVSALQARTRFPRQIVPPTPSDFSTWVNQNGASIDTLDDGVRLRATPGGTNIDNQTLRVRTLPSGNWWVELYVKKNWARFNYMGAGLALRESATGKLELITFETNGTGMSCSKWSSPTSFSDTRAVITEYPSEVFMRASFDGTNIHYYYDVDGSIFDFDLVTPFVPNNFFTSGPNQWGIFIGTNNRFSPIREVSADFLHWAEGTTP